VCDIAPQAPLAANQALSIAVMSYDGTMGFGLLADRDALPDVDVIAEGIETRATADLLMSMGCEQGQGYFFGRPMPATAFESQFLMMHDATTETLERGHAA